MATKQQKVNVLADALQRTKCKLEQMKACASCSTSSKLALHQEVLTIEEMIKDLQEKI